MTIYGFGNFWLKNGEKTRAPGSGREDFCFTPVSCRGKRSESQPPTGAAGRRSAKRSESQPPTGAAGQRSRRRSASQTDSSSAGRAVIDLEFDLDLRLMLLCWAFRRLEFSMHKRTICAVFGMYDRGTRLYEAGRASDSRSYPAEVVRTEALLFSLHKRPQDSGAFFFIPPPIPILVFFFFRSFFSFFPDFLYRFSYSVYHKQL